MTARSHTRNRNRQKRRERIREMQRERWFAARGLRRRRQRADLVQRDALTGLPDRRAVLAFAQQQFALCRRLDIELSVALLDLDHFNQINERLGQGGGDRVLRAVAQAAGEVLRGQERIGRWGGDEWLLVKIGRAHV